MMKIRVFTTFITPQVALAREHTSRRAVDAVNTVDWSYPKQPEHSDKQFVQQNEA